MCNKSSVIGEGWGCSEVCVPKLCKVRRKGKGVYRGMFNRGKGEMFTCLDVWDGGSWLLEREKRDV